RAARGRLGRRRRGPLGARAGRLRLARARRDPRHVARAARGGRPRVRAVPARQCGRARARRGAGRVRGRRTPVGPAAVPLSGQVPGLAARGARRARAGGPPRGGPGARGHRTRAALRRGGALTVRRLVLAVLALAVVGALAVFVGLRIPAVQDRVFELALSRLTSAANADWDDGATRVLFCGTSSPLPHPTRAKACVAVFAGGKFWVVDTGPGSWNTAALARIDGSKIGGVLLTHFHSDHIGDLGEWNLQTWVGGRPGPLPVYGGPGVERVVAGF